MVVRRNMTTQDWTRMLKSFRTKTYRNLPTDEDRASAGSALINTRSNSGGGGGSDANSRSKLIPDDSTPTHHYHYHYHHHLPPSIPPPFPSCPSLRRSLALYYTQNRISIRCASLSAGLFDPKIRPSVLLSYSSTPSVQDGPDRLLLSSFSQKKKEKKKKIYIYLS